MRGEMTVAANPMCRARDVDDAARLAHERQRDELLERDRARRTVQLASIRGQADAQRSANDARAAADLDDAGFAEQETPRQQVLAAERAAEWRRPEHMARVAAGRRHERGRGAELDAFGHEHFTTRRVSRVELRRQAWGRDSHRATGRCASVAPARTRCARPRARRRRDGSRRHPSRDSSSGEPGPGEGAGAERPTLDVPRGSATLRFARLDLDRLERAS